LRPVPSESTSPGGSFSKGFVRKFTSTRKNRAFASRVPHTHGIRCALPRRWIATAALA
jgi:hypothetical protein